MAIILIAPLVPCTAHHDQRASTRVSPSEGALARQCAPTAGWQQPVPLPASPLTCISTGALAWLVCVQARASIQQSKSIGLQLRYTGLSTLNSPGWPGPPGVQVADTCLGHLSQAFLPSNSSF